MLNTTLAQFYGWCAYLSAAATILTFLTGILFFTVGEPFGKINDTFSVFQLLLMIPLAVMFVQLLPTSHLLLALTATVLGIGGMLLLAVGQSLLVVGRIDFEGSLKFLPAGAAIGIWLVLVCLLAMVSGLLPQLLGWIGVLAGAGYVLTVAGFLKGGQQDPLFYLGGAVLGIAYPVWAIWLGQLLLSGL
jgi:hypothetical protein